MLIYVNDFALNLKKGKKYTQHFKILQSSKKSDNKNKKNIKNKL